MLTSPSYSQQLEDYARNTANIQLLVQGSTPVYFLVCLVPVKQTHQSASYL